MQIGLNLTLRAINASARFSPASLFAAGEQGAWYDPSDFSTLFQDSAGTTPVTAVEQPVGLMLDKSKGLTLGPELSAYASGFSSTTGITGIGATVTLSGASLVTTATSTDGSDRAEIPISGLTTGRHYLVTLVARRGAQGTHQIIRTSTALNIPNSLIASTSNQTFTFRVDAIAASGVIRVYAADAPGVGDSVIVDSISVRELPGNHAFQSTAASRPVLSARYNLLTKTEQFDDAAWTKVEATVTQNVAVAPNGTLTAEALVESSSNARHGAWQLAANGASGINTFSISAKANTRSWLGIRVDGVTSYFDISNGVVGTAAAGCVLSITAEGNGWFRCSVTKNWGSNQNCWAIVASADNTEVYTGDGTSGIFIWGADLRVTNTGTNLPAYQRVNTATDYDTAGFPLYLAFDGTDDWLQTNSINFTSTDKMTVFAGVRKLSDAAYGAITELSSNKNTNAGSFALFGPDASLSPGDFGFYSRGSVNVSSASFTSVAPITNVLSGTGNISGDQAILRVNGTQAAINTSDQGTGNYGNYQLFVGRRGGTTLPFNGRLYGLIVRGAATSAAQIQQAEAWMNQRTMAY